MPEPLLIRNIRIVDPVDGALEGEKDVFLLEGKILDIRPSRGRSALEHRAHSWKVVEGRGKFLIPGLVDAHVHLIGTHNPTGRSSFFVEDERKLLLYHGVTAVRNMKSFDRQLETSRNIDQRKIFAPKLVVASPTIDHRASLSSVPNYATVGYHCWSNWSNCAVKNGESATQLIQILAGRGFRTIKFRESIPGKLLRLMVAETHRLGLHAAGHVADKTIVGSFFVKICFVRSNTSTRSSTTSSQSQAPLPISPRKTKVAAVGIT